MHGAIRQEILLPRHCQEGWPPPGWLSIPLVLTRIRGKTAKTSSRIGSGHGRSHAGRNIDRYRALLFPADYNTAAVVLQGVYQTQGQLWTLVVPKAEVPALFTPQEAEAAGRRRLAAGVGWVQLRASTCAAHGAWRLPISGKSSKPRSGSGRELFPRCHLHA